MSICSVCAIGRTAASSRRRASSSEIVDVKGRIKIRLKPDSASAAVQPAVD
jgi:hypothetical protein